MRASLAAADSTAAARYLGTDTLTRLSTEGGEPGVVVDSVRVDSLAGDTAWVATMVTIPNWERVGGRYQYADYRMQDRGGDSALVASLPRVQDRWLLRLQLESGRWRWKPGLADAVAVKRHAILARDRDLPIRTRAALAAADSVSCVFHPASSNLNFNRVAARIPRPARCAPWRSWPVTRTGSATRSI